VIVFLQNPRSRQRPLSLPLVFATAVATFASCCANAQTYTIQTVAGGGTGVDNGPAIGAGLNRPRGVAVDAAGNLFISETGGNQIRKVSNGVLLIRLFQQATTGSMNGCLGRDFPKACGSFNRSLPPKKHANSI
jgi:hypothetical protein